MSEVKIVEGQFTKVAQLKGLIRRNYKVYTEDAALSEHIMVNLKWMGNMSDFCSYLPKSATDLIDKPYLVIENTLTTPSELQQIIDDFNKKPVIEFKLTEAAFGLNSRDSFNYEVYTDLDTALRIKEELSWGPASGQHCVFKPKNHTIGKQDHLVIYGCLNTPSELQTIINNL